MSKNPTTPVQNSQKATGGATGKGWVKGKSGNPGGRPRTSEFSAMVREFLHEQDPKKPDKTRLRLLVERLIVDDPKTLLAYAFGKPVETNVLQMDTDQPLRIVVQHAHEAKG